MNRMIILASATLCFAGVASAQTPAKGAEPPFTSADVEFMKDMMHHHAQALEMCDLAHDHAGPAVKTFCQRAEVSQRDEIEVMSKWLRARNQEAPEVMGHHHGAMEALEHSAMPGMQTPAHLAELSRANGAEFDRLFLQAMIRHHQGALTMVKTLFDTKGSGQGSEIFGIASGIDADQRAEIARMQALLAPR